ncbi:MAG: transcriptional regulator NrdR [Candidatus Marsarchaeota archaeon]|jgi:transcriptional repressor NrdR|nr:transcriptional regulator NrdR [Candidatus Marsarchaeota archaeon]
MRCPYCNSKDTDVVDSREVLDGKSIRRRRECRECGKRFTTYEKTDLIEITVIKKDGTREPFDRNKILNGLLKACEKRKVSREAIDGVVDRIEMKLRSKGKAEIKSREIGNMIVKELFKLDHVAYIRFASVYYNFDSPEEFRKIVRLFSAKPRKKK